MSAGRPAHDDHLTPKEWQIADAIRHGLSNAKIANRFGLSPNTVKFHIKNIYSKLGISSRAELETLALLPKNFPQNPKDTNMSDAKLSGSITQIARTVGNIETSTAFYADILGLPHLFSAGNMAFFDCGGVRLMLSSDQEAAPESILYFQVGDIQASHKRLQELGVDIISAPHMVTRHPDGTEEWMAFFNDPDKRPLGLAAKIAPSKEK